MNRVKPKYDIKGAPLRRVYADGVYAQEFTSLYAAKCDAEHRQKMDAEFEAEEPPCDCYGCVTMRHPCVKEVR